MRLSYAKAQKFAKSGRVLYRVMICAGTNRFRNPPTEHIHLFVEAQYFKGRGHMFTNFGFKEKFILNGTYGGYFTKSKQAEKFMKEIENGLHPNLIQHAREFHEEMDHLDEAMGICDRGLGGFEEHSEKLQEESFQDFDWNMEES